MKSDQIKKTIEVLQCCAEADTDYPELLEALERDLYAAEIKEFRDKLKQAMPSDVLRGTASTSDEEVDKFLNTDWVIKFGKHRVVVGNCASIYNAITDWLDEYIDDEL